MHVFFSEAKDVVKAKKRRYEVRNELLQAEQHLATLKDKLKNINTACEKQIQQVDEQHKCNINECQDKISDIDLAIAFIHKKKLR